MVTPGGSGSAGRCSDQCRCLQSGGGRSRAHTAHWPYTLGRQPVPNIAVVLHGFVFCEFTGTQMISVCNASVFWGDMTHAYHMFAVKVQKQKFHSEINRDRRAGEQLHTLWRPCRLSLCRQGTGTGMMGPLCLNLNSYPWRYHLRSKLICT